MRFAAAVDRALLAVPRRTQYAVLLATAVVILAWSLPRVPRQFADLSGPPLRVMQPANYGPDTIADMYGARVVLNDVGDMYTKAHVEQTPLEASFWTKEESAPYPPALRLLHAGMFALGERTGLGFYGLTLLLAVFFLAASAWYFLQTRWYLFPALYLNFEYFADRFVYVQDGSYLVMLACVMGALLLARRRRDGAAPLMALATVMKFLPLAYTRYLPRLPRRTAWAYTAILAAGLVAPLLIWDDYLYIYQFASDRKGNDWLDIAGALLLVVPFTLALWYVEDRMAFTHDARIGWSLVPFALLVGLLTNSGRHLLIALIVPDRHGGRNLAAVAGLTLFSLLPGVVRLGSLVYITTAVLCVVLACYLDRIGWQVVRDDLRHPSRTLRSLVT